MNRPLKILHLIDTGGPGGAERIFASLVQSLGRVDWEHHVLLPERGWLYQAMLCSGAKIVIRDGRGRFNVDYLLFLLKLISQEGISVVHAHLMGTSLYASLAGFFGRVPVVCTIHGYIDCPSHYRLFKLNLLARLASRIVTVSDPLKAYLLKDVFFGRRKFVTITNGIEKRCGAGNFPLSRDGLGIAQGMVVVGAIGNLKEEKRYDVLLEVAKVLKDKMSCHFLIAGSTDSETYQELLSQRRLLGLESSVTFCGYQDDVYSFLKLLDVFLLTSSSEGFSLATVEAMAGGIPVVATRSGGPEAIIVDHHNGLLADVGDVLSLVNAISKIATDPALRESLIANASKTVSLNYSSRTMVDRYEALYREVCGPRH